MQMKAEGLGVEMKRTRVPSPASKLFTYVFSTKILREMVRVRIEQRRCQVNEKRTT